MLLFHRWVRILLLTILPILSCLLLGPLLYCPIKHLLFLITG
jgi:hypothetical protein